MSAAACLLAASGPGLAADGAPTPVRVEVAQRDTGYRVEREFVGQVEAARRSQVGFELSGQLAEVRVQEGAAVAAGSLMARLDVDRLEARRAELRAALAQTRADLALATATRKRVEEAIDFNGVSLQEVDEARERERALAATVRLAEARVATIDVDIEKSSIRAPYDAVVARRFADEGQVLTAGQPVLELLEDAAPEARIGIAGEALGAVQAGQEVDVMSNGKRLSGRVRAVLPLRDAAARTRDVILELPPDAGLVPGDLIRMRLGRQRSTPGFWVPVGALTEASRGLWSLYVAEPLEGEEGPATHALARRVVQVIHTDDDRAYVSGTLRDGDAVVADGLQRVVPGQQVTIQEPSGRASQ
jgi:RND family efflux transporter MFP subunit